MGGTSRYDGYSWVTFIKKDGIVFDTVKAIAKDSKGNMWFGTQERGVSKYDGASCTNYTSRDGLVSNHVQVIFKDSKGTLWFATAAGVSFLTVSNG